MAAAQVAYQDLLEGIRGREPTGDEQDGMLAEDLRLARWAVEVAWAEHVYARESE